MKKSLLFLLPWYCIPASAANEGTFEYWFDLNPDQKIEGTISNGEINLNLDVSDLFEGIHLLTVRASNSKGEWSSPTNSFFVRTPLRAKNSKMTNYEYWYDGNTAEKTVGAVGDNGTVELTLNLSSVRLGVHTFSFRACDNNGFWTVPVTSLFVKVPPLIKDNRITGYEYWIDNKIENVVRKDADNDGFLCTDINVAALPYGVHTLSVRAVDKGGNYSIPVTHHFIKPVTQVAGNKIAGYRYWFNNRYDNAVYEGFDKAESPLLLDTDIFVTNIYTVVTRENIAVVEYPDGAKRIGTKNTLHTRFIDLNNRWSDIQVDTFAVAMKGPRIDLTGVIINPDADLDKEGWKFGGTSSIKTETNWENGKFFRLQNSESSMKQTISCLPEGKYSLSVKVRVKSGDAVIKANGVESEKVSSSDAWKEVVVNFTTDGTPFDIEAVCDNGDGATVDLDCWRLWTEYEDSVIDEIYFESVGGSFTALGLPGYIQLNNCVGCDIRIFSIGGQLVKRVKPVMTKELISMPHGIYIVTNGQKSFKVMVPN